MPGLVNAIKLAESGLVPDWMCRRGIRNLIGRRLKEEDRGSDSDNAAKLTSFVEALKESPLALQPEKPNEQHYELPPEFFKLVLGSHLKYSCCYWPEGTGSLDQAEEAALRITCQRSQLEDGQEILELGCGWGSLSLWMADQYPASRILAMSNSHLQKEFIEGEAARRGLSNLEVITSDINQFQTTQTFDRVVSVEMFEHARNYQLLLARIASWLRPNGKLFVHVFSHRQFAYPFETEGADNWMGRFFFTGGVMPSDDLLPRFQDDLKLEEQWRLNGSHYARTARSWLDKLDQNEELVLAVLAQAYGEENAKTWLARWRLFFMSCEELFAYRQGKEWGVSHYRFVNR